jgi:hypothetical protein
LNLVWKLLVQIHRVVPQSAKFFSTSQQIPWKNHWCCSNLVHKGDLIVKTTFLQLDEKKEADTFRSKSQQVRFSFSKFFKAYFLVFALWKFLKQTFRY